MNNFCFAAMSNAEDVRKCKRRPTAPPVSAVAKGTVTLPSDKSAYTTYGSDGKTTVKDRSTFTGDTTVNGEECTWSSVLSYDYTTANLTGNVGDTIRVIYAYITMNVEPEPDSDAPRD